MSDRLINDFLQLGSISKTLTNLSKQQHWLGGYAEGVPPDPIPNSEVKSFKAHDSRDHPAKVGSRQTNAFVLQKICDITRLEAAIMAQLESIPGLTKVRIRFKDGHLPVPHEYFAFVDRVRHYPEFQGFYGFDRGSDKLLLIPTSGSATLMAAFEKDPVVESVSEYLEPGPNLPEWAIKELRSHSGNMWKEV